MFKIQIFKSSILTNEASFETEEALTEWFSYHKGLKTFGEEAYSFEQPVLISEEIPAETEERELLDEDEQSFDPPQFETIEISPAIPAVYGSETVEVPASYEAIITDITEETETKAALDEKIEKGKAARQVCQKVLDLVAGYNLDRELTIQQITQMQATLASSEAALRAGRPTFAKAFISQVEADGVLVTQEMKDLCLQLLEGY